MGKPVFGIFLLGLIIMGGFLPTTSGQSGTNVIQFLASTDGLVSLHIPAGWYMASEETEDQSLLIAAPTPEAAKAWQAGGPLMVHVYLNNGEGLTSDELLQKTLKDYQLSGIALESSESNLWGLPALHYIGQNDRLKIAITLIMQPDGAGAIRFVASASPAEWDQPTYDYIASNLVVLSQQASPPRGWQSFIRAPFGWEQDDFSSFVQWTAPADGPFSGLEVWFQAGSRGELAGQGEAAFVLRNFGVNYSSQVDESLSYPAVIGGLPATAQPFESFTHSGIAYNATGGTDYGTANLVARAPLGQWTPAHQALVEAIAASVQIIPPDADSAPVGLSQGYRPPNFTGTFDDGSAFSLDQYEGQLVLLHFWFVDCPSCRAEWPHLDALYQEYQDDGLVLLAVNAIDAISYIETYQQTQGLNFPYVEDNGALHQLFNISLFPTTYVITPDGIINQVARGPLSERSLQNLINRYLLED